MPPGVRPADVQDQAARAQYEAALAKNSERITAFKTQSKLRNLHETTLDNVADFLKSGPVSLRTMPDTEGMIDRPHILAGDRDRLKAMLR